MYFDESRSLRMLGEGCMGKGVVEACLYASSSFVSTRQLVSRNDSFTINLSNRRVSASRPVRLADLASLPVD